MASLSARSLEHLLDGWRAQNSGPAYAALADRIRLLVLDGRMSLGTRLPAERELAEALGVSRTTVTTAYAELRESGYITSMRGSGSVARLPGRAPVTIESTCQPSLCKKATAAADRSRTFRCVKSESHHYAPRTVRRSR